MSDVSEPVERRLHPRHRVADTVVLERWLSDETAPLQATACDVSQGGVFLEVAAQLPAAAVVTIRVIDDLDDPDEVATAICAVVRQEEAGVGCRFVGLSDLAQRWVERQTSPEAAS